MVSLCEQDFAEGGYLLKKQRAPCWLDGNGGPPWCWLWCTGHRAGKVLTPTPATREGCQECGFAGTSANVLVGAAPCPQNGCAGGAGAACPGVGVAAISPPGTLGWVPFLTDLLVAFLLSEEAGAH